jgi:hypothetical protein
MFRRFTLLVLVLGLASSGYAYLQVSDEPEDTPATMARVARRGDEYFVAWRSQYDGHDRIRAACVSRDLLTVGPRFDMPTSGGNLVEALEVATLGERILVVYLEKNPVTGNRRVMSRLITEWNGVGDPKQVSPDESPGYSCPAVASCAGDSFLVVFHHLIQGPPEDHRVLRRGVYVASGEPSPLCRTAVGNADRPSLACDGEEFLLVYVGQPSLQVYGKHLLDGPVAPFLIYGNSTNGRPEVTYDATSGQFLTIFQEDRAGTTWLMARMCTLEEALGEDKVDIQPDVVDDCFAASASEMNIGVVWQQREPPSPDYIAARRVIQGCALVGPNENVGGSWALIRQDPHVAGFGEAFGVVWYGPDAQPQPTLQVWMDTVSSWQRHFYVRHLTALAHNNGRHLALDPETGWLHRVYFQPGLGEQPIDSVLYTYSTDDGDNWFPYEYLGPGRYPCVVCEDQENLPVWVCFVVDAGDPSLDTLKVLARQGPGDWKPFAVPFVSQPVGGCPEPPSMSMAYDEFTPKVYVACNMFVEGQSQRIVFYPVRLLTGFGDAEYVCTLCDVGDVPSLATTPLDLVHCVWGFADYGYGSFTNQVLYNRRLDGEWQLEFPEVASEPLRQDCIDPNVDQDGDLVFVTYSASIVVGAGKDAEYGDRGLKLHDPWGNYFNRSGAQGTPPPDSRYPQNSTKEATIWHEGRYWPDLSMIWLWLQGERHLFAHPLEQDAAWPHMCVVLNDPGGQGLIHVYGTWVEQVLGEDFWEVAFDYRTYQHSTDGPYLHPFYEVLVGDTVPSRYCRSRDGFARWRGFKVDYARENLSYRLPYLNPHCIYKLMAVLYQSSRSTWEQGFTIDDRSVCRARYRPETPETVLVTIPRDLYRRDFTVDLDIGRISGDYASVAELKLYEVYPFLEREGRDVYLPVCGSEHRLLEVAGANPFHSQARIQYSVPTAQQVSVRVYDVQGRVVNELASGPHASGEYTLSWTGTDDRGRQAAAGAYFVELKTETSGTTRKLVYAP